LPKRSPAALLAKSRTQQKSFLFLLEEKNRRAQIKKCEENFFAGLRALASGGGTERQSSQSGFSSKKVRILTKRHRLRLAVARLRRDEIRLRRAKRDYAIVKPLVLGLAYHKFSY